MAPSSFQSLISMAKATHLVEDPDYSHLETFCHQVLQSETGEGCNLYLFGFPDYFVVVLIPYGNAPSSVALYHSKRHSERDSVVDHDTHFVPFNELGFSWKSVNELGYTENSVVDHDTHFVPFSELGYSWKSLNKFGYTENYCRRIFLLDANPPRNDTERDLRSLRDECNPFVASRERVNHGIHVLKIYPLNFPSKVSHDLENPWYNELDVTVIDTAHGLRPPMLRNNLNFQGTSSENQVMKKFLIAQIGLVDLLEGTKRTDIIRPNNPVMSVRQVFDADRIAQYLMIENDINFIGKVIMAVGDSTKHLPRPFTLSQFLFECLFKGKRVDLPRISTTEKIATDTTCTPLVPTFLRMIDNQLSIKFLGTGFKNIYGTELLDHVKSAQAKRLILGLLHQLSEDGTNRIIRIPPSALLESAHERYKKLGGWCTSALAETTVLPQILLVDLLVARNCQPLLFEDSPVDLVINELGFEQIWSYLGITSTPTNQFIGSIINAVAESTKELIDTKELTDDFDLSDFVLKVLFKGEDSKSLPNKSANAMRFSKQNPKQIQVNFRCRGKYQDISGATLLQSMPPEYAIGNVMSLLENKSLPRKDISPMIDLISDTELSQADDGSHEGGSANTEGTEDQDTTRQEMIPDMIDEAIDSEDEAPAELERGGIVPEAIDEATSHEDKASEAIAETTEFDDEALGETGRQDEYFEMANNFAELDINSNVAEETNRSSEIATVGSDEGSATILVTTEDDSSLPSVGTDNGTVAIGPEHAEETNRSSEIATVGSDEGSTTILVTTEDDSSLPSVGTDNGTVAIGSEHSEVDQPQLNVAMDVSFDEPPLEVAAANDPSEEVDEPELGVAIDLPFNEPHEESGEPELEVAAANDRHEEVAIDLRFNEPHEEVDEPELEVAAANNRHEEVAIPAEIILDVEGTDDLDATADFSVLTDYTALSRPDYSSHEEDSLDTDGTNHQDASAVETNDAEQRWQEDNGSHEEDSSDTDGTNHQDASTVETNDADQRWQEDNGSHEEDSLDTNGTNHQDASAVETNDANHPVPEREVVGEPELAVAMEVPVDEPELEVAAANDRHEEVDEPPLEVAAVNNPMLEAAANDPTIVMLRDFFGDNARVVLAFDELQPPHVILQAIFGDGAALVLDAFLAAANDPALVMLEAVFGDDAALVLDALLAAADNPTEMMLEAAANDPTTVMLRDFFGDNARVVLAFDELQPPHVILRVIFGDAAAMVLDAFLADR